MELWGRRKTCAVALVVACAMFISTARLGYRTPTAEDALELRSLHDQPSISWGNAVSDLVLGLRCSRQELQLDDEAEFTIYLKNEGQAPWHVPGLFVGLKVPAIRIYDAMGQEVRFRQVVLEIDIGSGEVIQPGQVMSVTQSITLSNKEWEGGAGKHRAKAVYDTRALQWGERQDLSASPLGHWVGICQSGDVLFHVQAEQSGTAWRPTQSRSAS